MIGGRKDWLQVGYTRFKLRVSVLALVVSPPASRSHGHHMQVRLQLTAACKAAGHRANAKAIAMQQNRDLRSHSGWSPPVVERSWWSRRAGRGAPAAQHVDVGPVTTATLTTPAARLSKQGGQRAPPSPSSLQSTAAHDDEAPRRLHKATSTHKLGQTTRQRPDGTDGRVGSSGDGSHLQSWVCRPRVEEPQ